MFESFHEVTGNVSRTIITHEKKLARPVIGVMPAYFPLELIYAAGGYPVQLWGNPLPPERADAFLQSYCCSVARSVLELELRGGAEMVKAYAFTSLCDTLVNLREIYKSLFKKPTLELSIPMTRTDDARRTYLDSVIQRLVADLEGVTGQGITDISLAEAARLYGQIRSLQREFYQIRRENPGLVKNHDFYTVIKAGFFLPPAEYQQMLADLLPAIKDATAPAERRSKIIVSGMIFDPLNIMTIFDDAGIHIVDDDFANGWRTVSKTDLKTEDLTAGITAYLFNPAPCCCLYNPGNDRHTYLIDMLRQSGAQGILFWNIKFCEPDAFDRPQLSNRLKDENIPTGLIDVELGMTNFDALRTRINAFGEILEG
jgi:bcr-type benzoyl-CoA reductase subunit C